MKRNKLYWLGFILCLSLAACTKENPEETGTEEIIQSASNSTEEVIPGKPNCTEAISGNIRLKAAADASASSTVKIDSRTEKLYPSGGYILVFDLTRKSNVILLEYKQVNTACGNPAAAAFMPAFSSPRITNLSPGSYPIEIRVNGNVNKGVLQVSQSGSPALVMQTTNGIIIE